MNLNNIGRWLDLTLLVIFICSLFSNNFETTITTGMVLVVGRVWDIGQKIAVHGSSKKELTAMYWEGFKNGVKDSTALRTNENEH